MKKLIFVLQWNHTSVEMEEILSDFNDFFSKGLEEQKTEEELCEVFGDPKDIVRDMKITATSNKKININFFIRILLVITLFASILFYLESIQTSRNVILYTVATIMVTTIFLWVILRGALLNKLVILYELSYKKYKKILILHVLLLLLAILNYFFILTLSKGMMDILSRIFQVEIYKIGPLVLQIHYFMIGVGVLIFIYSIYGYYNQSLKFYTVSCHCIGYISFLICLRDTLYQITDINNLYPLINTAWIVYFLGIILSIFFAVYSHYIRRKTAWILK